MFKDTEVKMQFWEYISLRFNKVSLASSATWTQTEQTFFHHTKSKFFYNAGNCGSAMTLYIVYLTFHQIASKGAQSCFTPSVT